MNGDVCYACYRYVVLDEVGPFEPDLGNVFRCFRRDFVVGSEAKHCARL